MTTIDKKAAFEKEAREIVRKTIIEHRVLFTAIMIEASAEVKEENLKTSEVVL